jgi:uncharacterized protein (TIGR03435 family)
MGIYGVDAIPATFLIDPRGRIAAITDPAMLSSSMLEDLQFGRPLGLELTIQRHRDDWSMPSSEGINFTSNVRFSLRALVALFWGLAPSRVIGDPLDGAGIFDLVLSTPAANPATFRIRAREIIAGAFGVHVRIETRDAQVWVLAKTDAKPAALKPIGTISDLTGMGTAPPYVLTKPTIARVPGRIKNVNTSMSDIAKLLEAACQRPVVDETGIEGRYDFQMTWEESGPEGVIDAFRALGFKIEPERRPIDFLVVTKLENASFQ